MADAGGNGRIYDSKIGRFLSADKFVQDAGNTQNYNRYSYCLNNPLKYSDPSGWFLVPLAPKQSAVWSGWLALENMSADDQGSVSNSDNNWVDSYLNNQWKSSQEPSQYHSDGTGKYYDQYGNQVSWNEVYHNDVVPNGQAQDPENLKSVLRFIQSVNNYGNSLVNDGVSAQLYGKASNKAIILATDLSLVIKKINKPKNNTPPTNILIRSNLLHS